MTRAYKLSREADKDLEAIFDYTEFEYGIEKAADYTTQFSSVFYQLSQEPELGRARNEIKSKKA